MAKYPADQNGIPSGHSTRFNEIAEAGKKLNMGDPRQYATDVVNAEWYQKVEEAFRVLSQDVNGNGGRGLARAFASEHPELQHEWLEALRTGMCLAHKELRECVQSGIYTIDRERLDGRVRIWDASFVVGVPLEYKTTTKWGAK